MDLSARWLLTIMCGIVFIELSTASIILAYLHREPILGPTEFMAILMLVFQSYFMRSDRKNGDVK